jgi:hypothetical protein
MFARECRGANSNSFAGDNHVLRVNLAVIHVFTDVEEFHPMFLYVGFGDERLTQNDHKPVALSLA